MKNLLWGFWNGSTAWVLFLAHLFGRWREYPVYDTKRSGGWYDFGFLIGASSSLVGSAGRSRGKRVAKPVGKEKSKADAA